MPGFAEGFAIGSVEAENRGLRDAIGSWRAYARKLEMQNKYLRKEVAYYRIEAAGGWATWKAAEKIAQEKFGYSLRDDPDIDKIAKEFLDDMYDAVDRDVKKRFEEKL